jgi:very-short-patch-repair endonuclease
MPRCPRIGNERQSLHVQGVIDALIDLGGIATRGQLLDRGFTGGQLTQAVREHRIRRVRRGHYASFDADVERRAAVRLGGRLGCVSALKALGLWSSTNVACVHVTLPRNAGRLRVNMPLKDRERFLRPGESLTADQVGLPVLLHWRDVPVGSRTVDASAWRVDLATALADVAGCAARRDVRAAFESAVHSGRISLEAAQRLLDEALAVDAEPMTLSATSGSGVESHLIEELIEQDLAFEQQVWFSGVGRVDFVVDGCLVVETDGYEHHSSKEQFEADRARDAAMLALGYPTLRIPARVILEEPERAAEMLRASIKTARAMREAHGEAA